MSSMVSPFSRHNGSLSNDSMSVYVFVLASIILSYDVALLQLVVKLAEAKAKIRRKCVISKLSSRVGQV